MTDPYGFVKRNLEREVIQLCADAAKLRKEKEQLRLVIVDLTDALFYISQGWGRFKRDPHEHALATIDDMKQVAVDAIAGVWEAPENFDRTMKTEE